MSHVLITTDAVGGVWSYSLALAAGLVATGRRCTLAVLGPAAGADQAQAARDAGCLLLETGLPLDWLTPDRATLDRTVQSLALLAARIGATSAHLHAPCLAAPPLVAPRLAAPRLAGPCLVGPCLVGAVWPVPVIAAAHSCMTTWWDTIRGGARPAGFAWHTAATLEGLTGAARIVAPTRAFAAEIRRAYAIARPVDIIHNGLPPAPTGTVARQDFILTAGRLWDESKNIAVLDSAAALLRTPVRAAGPLASPDGAAYAPTHIEPLGNLPAGTLRSVMARAAIFAAPSIYEPFGLAVLEAAQTGAPLVLADIATFRELWTGAALFAPPRDPAAWADTLRCLIADPAARAELGRAAQARAVTYTRHAMVQATASLHAALPSRACKAA